MKKRYFVYYYLLATLCLLLCLLISCSKRKNVVENQSNNMIVVVDTIFTPTGNPEIDSLLSLLPTIESDTNKVEIYLNIAEIYEDFDFEKAKEYYLLLNKYSKQLNYQRGIFSFAVGFSHVITREGLLDSALTIIFEALEIAKKEENEIWIGKLKFGAGNVYLLKQWYETALGYYLEALDIFDKEGEKERLAVIYFQLSLLYTDMSLFEKAIEYGEKSIEVAPNDPYSFLGLAQAYLSIQQYDKSLNYFEEALRLSHAQKNLYLEGMIYYHIGDNYLMNFNLNKAELYVNKALQINSKVGNENAFYASLSLLGKVEALNGNFAQAEEYVKKALQKMEETENKQGASVCYMVLSELSVAQSKFKENIQYWKEWEKLKNEIAAEATLIAVNEIAEKFETAKKNLEIKNQKNIISTQKLQLKMLIGGIAFCVLILLLLTNLIVLRTRHNRMLTQTNAVKDKFFNIVSHDLKNPAIAQRDSIEFLQKKTSKWNDDLIAKYFAELLNSANNYVVLLYNLLNWSQLQTKRMPYKSLTFNLLSSLDSEILLLKEMAKGKDITLLTQFPTEAFVTADKNMITMIIRNLMTNAVKFTNKGGQVILDISPAENTSPQKFIISITDNGIGMSKEQIQNLYLLDKKQSNKGTAGESGTGLGLIICKELLEMHKSQLNIESEEGKGSRFWFEI